MAPSNRDVVEMMEFYFKNYKLTEENLRKPTPEFVMNFYWGFLNEIKRQFNSVCRCKMELISLFKQKDREMIMLQQLNDILRKLNEENLTSNLKITLADLYAPTPERTRMFVYIFIHFLLFLSSSNCVKYAEVLFKEIPTQDEISTIQHKIDENIKKLNNNACVISELKEDKVKLKEKLIESKEKMKRLRDKKVEKDRVLSMKRNEIRKLQLQKENLCDSLSYLERREQRLREQVVTEKHYKYLQKNLEEINLEMEEYETQEQEIGEYLHSTKQTISHLQNVLAHLNSLKDLNHTNIELLDVFEEKIVTLKPKLKSLEYEKSSLNADKTKNLNESRNLALLIKQYEKVMEEITKQTEELKKESLRATEATSEQKLKIFVKYKKINKELKNEFDKIKQDKEKLLNGCAKKYNE